ncbi:MAG TPA: TIGR03617 family F420-dependent LLM class oxidoreductase [Candidatus Limnocylindria bacterium]|nr:TIGR03617 family F420-dependent LLM class oxidoreductase [Candidatus Limnocylindria bacterium]
MKFDASLLVHDLGQMPALARFADEAGFDGIWTFETAHDPFLPLVLAAEHSRRLSLGTSIAVAFARSPTILAHIAWDLALFSQGRFILGLGTQVKGHNERRFGVKWEKPVDKMRETILAVRAIWASWQNQSRLNFQGEFFKLTLMTPFFSPAPHNYHRIPIFIAGVNRRMCELGGELCDGFHVHPLHTARYLRVAVLPHIEAGLAKSGRVRQSIELSSSIFVIPSDDAEEAVKYEAEVRRQISFYASTPHYRPVFDLEGWGEVADRLKAMAARGRWDEMPLLITEEMLDRLTLRGTWAELPQKVLEKYTGLLDRVSYYFPVAPGQNEDAWRATLAGFKRRW